MGNIVFNHQKRVLKKMQRSKTSPAVLLRMSNDFLWIDFIQNVCISCKKDICTHVEARHCFDDWMSDPLANIPSKS